ncbi:MAG TPA: hypothetical protein H9915_03345 [Candidatus Gemmiger faecigallinarum]|nr:hypothetical protein [Candidatus Gemmiger faecigallinarum]
MERKQNRGQLLWCSLLGALALLCIVAAAVWFALSARQGQQTPQGYLLRDNGGRLALYAADGTGPLAEYDIYTRLLPEQDFLALQQGVAVADEAELQKRLEDYGW